MHSSLGNLPFLQESHGILQVFILLLELLVSTVKHFKPLRISVEDKHITLPFIHNLLRLKCPSH